MVRRQKRARTRDEEHEIMDKSFRTRDEKQEKRDKRTEPTDDRRRTRDIEGMMDTRQETRI